MPPPFVCNLHLSCSLWLWPLLSLVYVCITITVSNNIAQSLLQQEKDRAQALVAQAEERVNKTAQENADLTKELEVLTARLAAAPVAIPISPTTRPLELQMRYEETSRALQAEKSENRRLSNYLNQILKEIEDKVISLTSISLPH